MNDILVQYYFIELTYICWICDTSKIEELNEYLPSMKFDSYYDDNLLPPEVGENAAALS